MDMKDPLRDFKRELFNAAKIRLWDDLSDPALPHSAMEIHRASFEALLDIHDFVDLSFHLDALTDRTSRFEGSRSVLEHAQTPTLFDFEALEPGLRGIVWEKRVAEMSRRLGIDVLSRLAERSQLTHAKRQRFARRLRRNLGEFLSVTHGNGPLRDDMTPFMLSRIETAVAACLRLLDRYR
jgi:hypothetical protein